MTTLKIKDCLINRKGEIFSISDFPYYQALKNDSEQEYQKSLLYSKKQQGKHSGTWRGYQKLVEKIRKKGFDVKKSPIRFSKNQNGKFVCNSGRHRMCILLHLYGEDLQLKINNRFLTKIKLK